MPYFYDNRMYSVDPDLKDLQKTVNWPDSNWSVSEEII